MNGQTVRVYSKAKDGNTQLTKNFQVKEFACSDGTDTIFISSLLVSVLQNVRDHYGKAVHINSAYRTESHNKKIGGAAYSQHKYGIAADIHIDGVKPKDLAAYIETLIPTSGGIGIYSSFVHVDVRRTRARWNG